MPRQMISFVIRFFMIFTVTVYALHGIGRTSAHAFTSSCIQCHAKMTGRLGEPVHKWKTGIHASKGVSCHTCHGGDPNAPGTAMSITSGFNGAPFKIFINTFCGRCHERTLQDYLTSAHGRTRDDGGATCVSCHGSHQIDRATMDLINEHTCSQCHPLERVQPFKNQLQITHDRIRDIQDRMTAVKIQGKDTSELVQRLKASKAKSRRLAHMPGSEHLTIYQKEFDRELDEIEKKLNYFEAARQERILKELLN